MNYQIPTVGRIVHFFETPNDKNPKAAIVTSVNVDDSKHVDLQVFGFSGIISFFTNVSHGSVPVDSDNVFSYYWEWPNIQVKREEEFSVKPQEQKVDSCNFYQSIKKLSHMGDDISKIISNCEKERKDFLNRKIALDILHIEFIAKACHEVNKAYCESLNDHSQVGWDSAPDWQKESAINGVKFHLKNPDSTPESSHDNWAKEKLAEGWKYGPVKDAEKKEHPCLIPYCDLPQEQRSKDYIFKAIVDLYIK